IDGPFPVVIGKDIEHHHLAFGYAPLWQIYVYIGRDKVLIIAFDQPGAQYVFFIYRYPDFMGGIKNGIPDDFRVLLRGTALTAYEVFHDIPVIGYPVHKAFDIPPLFRKRLMIQYISCSVYILAVYELRRNR